MRETHTCIALHVLRMIKPYAALRVPPRWPGPHLGINPSSTVHRPPFTMADPMFESLDAFTADHILKQKGI
jgi:hypothetical protein